MCVLFSLVVEEKLVADEEKEISGVNKTNSPNQNDNEMIQIENMPNSTENLITRNYLITFNN